MLYHAGVILILEPHYLPEYRDLIYGVHVLQHRGNLLLEFIGLVLFIKVIVQARVDEASNVCRCFHVHYLLGRNINLVQSFVSKLY